MSVKRNSFLALVVGGACVLGLVLAAPARAGFETHLELDAEAVAHGALQIIADLTVDIAEFEGEPDIVVRVAELPYSSGRSVSAPPGRTSRSWSTRTCTERASSRPSASRSSASPFRSCPAGT